MPSPPPRARRPAALTARAAAVVALVLVPLAHSGSTATAALVLPLHARLASSVPLDGSTVETAEEVVLTFSEDVNPSFVAVTVEGPGGDETDGTAVVDGREVTQPLAADLGAGDHAVTFRVVSADGHPVSGTVAFTTTRGASVQPTGGATASPAPPSQGGSATATASPAASAPAPVTSADAGEAASSESLPSTWWAVTGIAALLLAAALAGAIRRSRTHRSGATENEEPAGP